MVRRSSRQGGFTLVELLVVIGIIALLLSILLPTLSRIKEKARQVKCMSNIRQLSQACLMFATDHNGLMPGKASGSIQVIDPASGSMTSAAALAIAAGVSPGSIDDSPFVKDNVADWIAWYRRKDADTGIMSTAANQNITYSGLARYLGSKIIYTPPGDYDAANRANPALEEIFTCPSDTRQFRPSRADSSHGIYRYSYAINTAYSNPIYAFPNIYGGPAYAPGVRVDGRFNGRHSSIRKASSKVLFICQDEKTLDDGSFTPNPALWFERGSDTLILDVVSARHSKRSARANSKRSGGGNNAEGYEDVMGNVGFADGHGDFLSRKDALRSRHSGNPNRDPPGF